MFSEEGSARAKTGAEGGNSALGAAVFTTAPETVGEAELWHVGAPFFCLGYLLRAGLRLGAVIVVVHASSGNGGWKNGDCMYVHAY